MPTNQRVVVRGVRELLVALKTADTDTRRYVRAALRDSGEAVRKDAAERLSKYSSRSAAGLKVRVRQRGVAVEQSLRKTTGKRPDYGALQMRKALLPARSAEYENTYRLFEEALDKVAERFNHE